VAREVLDGAHPTRDRAAAAAAAAASAATGEEDEAERAAAAFWRGVSPFKWHAAWGGVTWTDGATQVHADKLLLLWCKANSNSVPYCDTIWCNPTRRGGA
jgi:hypothetical protein